MHIIPEDTPRDNSWEGGGMAGSREMERAVSCIRSARHLSAVTGAGISVESGIPPFRGENGLWTKYDPELFDISYFRRKPAESWKLLKTLFYDTFKDAKPNEAHAVLARLEAAGTLKALITQNIDNLHTIAGSRNVIEYHGSVRDLVCLECRKRVPADPAVLQTLPPRCGCGGVLKPDIVFFGEEIPLHALLKAESEIEKTDALLVVGTTGEVYPAAFVPMEAKRNGAVIVEVNVLPSSFSVTVSDIFLEGKASEVMAELGAAVGS
jgi:NAD-dependent deacetylase